MARILAYTSPARGHLYPIVPILQELRGRGHEIALRTLTSQVELASGLGFDASSIDPAIEHIEHHDYLEVVVMLDVLDGGIDRRRVEAEPARQLDLGGQGPQRNLVAPAPEFLKDRDDWTEVSAGRTRVRQDANHIPT